MSFTYAYPDSTLSAIYFQTGRHIQASDPFMADPMLFNEKSKEIFDKLETRLGDTIQLNSPHYFQSQAINSFLDVDLDTLSPQSLVNITFPVKLAELKLGSEITLSNNEISWQYQQRPDYLTSEFRNLNNGLTSSFASTKFNYSTNVYRNSNQIYRAIIDRSANQVAVPYLKDQSNIVAKDSSLAADTFNIMRLEEKIEHITRVIGKPIHDKNPSHTKVNIISRTVFKKLAGNLASEYVQPLTLETYEDSKDTLVETPNEVYALADYSVMDNKHGEVLYQSPSSIVQAIKFLVPDIDDNGNPINKPFWPAQYTFDWSVFNTKAKPLNRNNRIKGETSLSYMTKYFLDSNPNIPKQLLGVPLIEIYAPNYENFYPNPYFQLATFLSFGDVFFISGTRSNAARFNGGLYKILDLSQVQFIRPNTTTPPSLRSIIGLDGINLPLFDILPTNTGTPFCLTIGKPYTRSVPQISNPDTLFPIARLPFDENNPDTWNIFSERGGGQRSFNMVCPLVGDFRPFVVVYTEIETEDPEVYTIVSARLLDNDPNVNVVLYFSEDDLNNPLDSPNTWRATKEETQRYNILDRFFHSIFEGRDSASEKTTGSLIIPLCGPREHVLTYKNDAHYEFSVSPKIVQPYENISFDSEINNTFMKFIDFIGNPKVVHSVPVNIGYQISYLGRSVQRLTSVAAVTTAFDNYQLNLGAISIYNQKSAVLSV
jgi:hypothetical protein